MTKKKTWDGEVIKGVLYHAYEHPFIGDVAGYIFNNFTESEIKAAHTQELIVESKKVSLDGIVQIAINNLNKSRKSQIPEPKYWSSIQKDSDVKIFQILEQNMIKLARLFRKGKVEITKGVELDVLCSSCRDKIGIVVSEEEHMQNKNLNYDQLIYPKFTELTNGKFSCCGSNSSITFQKAADYMTINHKTSYDRKVEIIDEIVQALVKKIGKPRYFNRIPTEIKNMFGSKEPEVYMLNYLNRTLNQLPFTDKKDQYETLWDVFSAYFRENINESNRIALQGGGSGKKLNPKIYHDLFSLGEKYMEEFVPIIRYRYGIKEVDSLIGKLVTIIKNDDDPRIGDRVRFRALLPNKDQVIELSNLFSQGNLYGFSIDSDVVDHYAKRDSDYNALHRRFTVKGAGIRGEFQIRTHLDDMHSVFKYKATPTRYKRRVKRLQEENPHIVGLFNAIFKHL